MILGTVIQLANNDLKEAKLSSKAFGLCEILKKEDKKFPAEMINGDWVSVGGYDRNALTTYWRKTGATTVRNVRNETQACKTVVEISYPLRLVMVAQHSKKSAYNEETLFERALAAISKKYSVSQTIWAKMEVTGCNTDRESIEGQEYVGIDFKMRTRFAYLSINCTLTVKADQECLSQGNND